MESLFEIFDIYINEFLRSNQYNVDVIQWILYLEFLLIYVGMYEFRIFMYIDIYRYMECKQLLIFFILFNM